MPRGLLHRRDQFIDRQVMRAGAGHEDRVAREELHRHLVQLAVGRKPLRQVALALDEGRRIDDDQIELLPRLAQRRERIESVVAKRAHGEAVCACGLLEQRERRGRGVDADDLAGSRAGGRETPGPQVGEHVEHPRARRVRQHGPAVRRLVVEPAGFLAAAQRQLEPHAVLLEPRVLGGLAERGLDIGRQSLELADATVVLPDHGARSDHLLDGLE